MIELVDCHTHSNFSDGDSTLRDNAMAARALGLSTICFTDHWGLPPWVDCSIAAERMGDYASQIAQLQEEFPDLHIIHGLECDWYPGCEDDIAQTKAGATFLLGSIHYLDQMAIDWSADMRVWDQRGANWVWEHYVDQWCQMAASGIFNSLAHPDLPRLFWDQHRPSLDLAPLHDQMVDAARDAQVPVEVSCAALAKGLGDYYPVRALLAKFLAAGVPLTVGTDAHRADRVGQGIYGLYAHLHAMGARSIQIPCPGGGWRTLEL